VSNGKTKLLAIKNKIWGYPKRTVTKRIYGAADRGKKFSKVCFVLAMGSEIFYDGFILQFRQTVCACSIRAYFQVKSLHVVHFQKGLEKTFEP
jgi:hypothetical protein